MSAQATLFRSETPTEGPFNDPLAYITQEYTHALENVIRTAPEQYLWVHRRWKHRPKGEERPAAADGGAAGIV